jgi:hypothetical protein
MIPISGLAIESDQAVRINAKIPFKVLSSVMDLAESRFIGQVVIKE